MVAVPVKESDVDEFQDLEQIWKVVVWDDPVNTIPYVIWVFKTLFGYDEEKATRLTMQVHNEGRAIVFDGERDAAENACFALHRHGLWATLER